MASRKTCIRSEAGIRVWRVEMKGDASVFAFYVDDPQRTPETWPAETETEALAILKQRLLAASKTT